MLRLCSALVALFFFFPKQVFSGWQEDVANRAEKVLDEARDKSVQTKFSVKRGATVVNLDFANAGDVAKVNPGDTVQLEEGRYTGFGGLKAKGVRFVGKGVRETFVSTGGVREGHAAAIPLNHFEFWDLTLVENQFEQAAGDKLFLLGTRLAGMNGTQVGEERKAPEGLVVVLTHATDTADLPATTPQILSWTHHSPPDLSQLSDYDALDNVLRKSCFEKKLPCPAVPEGEAKKVLGLIPKAKQNLANIASIDAKRKAAYAEGMQKFQSYVVAHSGGEALASANGESGSKEYDALVAKADAAKKKKRDFAALLYLDAANKLTSSANAFQVAPLMSEITQRLRGDWGCYFGGDTTSASAPYEKELVAQITAESPLIAMGGEKSRCRVKVISFDKAGDKYFREKKVLERTAVLKETDEHRQAREAKDRAAWAEKQAREKAADRARQLRVDAATEKMTDLTRRAGEGRMQVDTAAGTMQYGSGNWNGKASAGTQAALDSAEAQARGGSGAPNEKGGAEGGYVKVGENLKLGTERIQESVQMAKAYVEVQGAKAEEIKGPTLNSKETSNCVVKREHSGNFEDSAECSGTKREGNTVGIAEYVKAHLQRPVLKAIIDKFIAGAKAKTLTATKSADAEEQLDAKLRATALGLAAYGDLAALTKKATGVELKNKEELAQILRN